MSAFGRYDVHAEIASGGMASVRFGTVRGDHGFRRVVAVKTMHPSLAGDPRFVAMFRDEALLASRVRHPNVVPVLDVVSDRGEVAIVMEYVRGLPLSSLLARASEAGEAVPTSIAVAILGGVLAGLHAAHEARGADGSALDLVHRDVSPQNVLVDTDGVARVVDFGIAKASAQLHVTLEGEVKGKLAFMAPEQIRSGAVDRRADVYAAGVVFYTMVLGRPLFGKGEVDEVMREVLDREVPRLDAVRADVGAPLADVIARAIERDPAGRFPTARDLAIAIETAFDRPASARQVGAWVERLGQAVLAICDREVARIEGSAEVPDRSDVAHVSSEGPLEVTGTDAPTVELFPPAERSSTERAHQDAPRSGASHPSSPPDPPARVEARASRPNVEPASGPAPAEAPLVRRATSMRTLVALALAVVLVVGIVAFAFWLPGADDHDHPVAAPGRSTPPLADAPVDVASAAPTTIAATTSTPPVATTASTVVDPVPRPRPSGRREYFPARP